jgi:hypothetical protein
MESFPDTWDDETGTVAHNPCAKATKGKLAHSFGDYSSRFHSSPHANSSAFPEVFCSPRELHSDNPTKDKVDRRTEDSAPVAIRLCVRMMNIAQLRELIPSSY